MDPDWDARLERLMRAAATKQVTVSPNVKTAFAQLQKDINHVPPFKPFDGHLFNFSNNQPK